MAVQLYAYSRSRETKPKARGKVENKAIYDLEPLGKFASARGSRNIHLAKGVDKAFYRQDVDAEQDRNNHVLVVGGSGAGKTRGFVIQNILAAPARGTNLVVIDPKGECYRETAKTLCGEGYEVSAINLVDLERTSGFDPLLYVKNAGDIESMVEMLVRCGLGEFDETHTKEPFWAMSKRQAIKACLEQLFNLEASKGVLAPGGDPSGHNKYLTMNNFIRLINLLPPVRCKNRDEVKSPLAEVFRAALAERDNSDPELPFNPNMTFLAVSGNPPTTFSCVATETLAGLGALRAPEMALLYGRSGIDLDKMDEGKKALFIIKSDNDSSRDGIANLAIKLMLNRLQRKADSSQSGVLERPVEFFLDEFANIGRIADFERIISTARSRGMNFYVIVQAISQLQAVYGLSAGTIIKNCDTFLYMGGGSSTADDRFVSDLCGTTTVATRRVGIEGVERPIEDVAITPSQIGQMSRNKCIVKFSNAGPVVAEKLDFYSSAALPVAC